MAHFEMCAACRAEYDNPSDRRFHAQPTACPTCGPRLQLVHTGQANGTLWRSPDPRDACGNPVWPPTTDPNHSLPISPQDALTRFVEALQAGGIGAMKGLGGYHLVCDARNQSAVRELRRRKHRDEKPLAIMVADTAAAQVLCALTPEEGVLLRSP
jgi:hydrogenase maturation protein HypF